MDKFRALDTMAALSHQTRLDAFRLLVQVGAKGLAAGEIAVQLGVVQNTMSAHLANLRNAEVICRKRQGTVIRYYANYQAMRGLLGFLMEDCCNGRPELCDPYFESGAAEKTSKGKLENV